MLENYFNYKKHKTNFKTEVIAGTTTFLTMAYIMFLNPFILSGEFAGPEKGFSLGADRRPEEVERSPQACACV